MFSLRITSSRLTATRVLPALQSRFLSSQSEVAVARLREALERYRQENYTQELPSRFKKEIVLAAAEATGKRCEKDDCSLVAMEGLERVLANIGASNVVSHEDMEKIFDEMGNGHREIPAKDIMSHLL